MKHRLILILTFLCTVGYAQTLTKEQLPFIDYDGTAFSFDDLRSDKALFMVNSQPQCHGCAESIYEFFSQTKFRKCSLYIVDLGARSYLEKKNLIRTLEGKIKRKFTALFVNGSDYKTVIENLNQPGYPILLLYDKSTGQVEVLASDAIFVDDLSSSEIRPKVRERLRNFAN